MVQVCIGQLYPLSFGMLGSQPSIEENKAVWDRILVANSNIATMANFCKYNKLRTDELLAYSIGLLTQTTGTFRY